MTVTGNITFPTFEVKLCEEDRARIDRVTAALEALAGPTMTLEHVKELFPQETQEAVTPLQPFPTETAPQSAEPTQEAPKPAEPKELPPEPPKAEPEPPQSAPEVTAAELQAKVVNLVSTGKKEETRAIIMEYAPRVGEIPAEKRAEVLERLNALEG